jgi:peptide/nickel transport system substrate-binding protein
MPPRVADRERWTVPAPNLPVLDRRSALVGLGCVALGACHRGGVDTTPPAERALVAVSGQSGRSLAALMRMQVVETLVSLDDKGAFAPGLAQGWDVSPDGRAWRFFLRPGARFHDGLSATPLSVVQALKRSGALPVSLAGLPVEAIEPMDRAVGVRLSAPSNRLAAALADPSAAILGPGAFDGGGVLVKAVGTGPYRAEALSDQGFAFSLGPVDADAPRPAVAKGRFAAVADAPARAAMLEKGQADLAFDLDPASLSRLRGRKGIAVIGTAALGPRLLVTAPGTLRPARLAWSDAGSAL